MSDSDSYNSDDWDPYPQEEEMRMKLHDDWVVDAGIFWISHKRGDPERRIVSTDDLQHFSNITGDIVLHALEMQLKELGWFGPVTVLPEPAASYHNHVILMEEGYADELMRNWILGMVQDEDESEILSLRVYVASHEGIGNISNESQLQTIIDSLDDGTHLTWWFFFEFGGNEWEGTQINPRLPNEVNEEEEIYRIIQD